VTSGIRSLTTVFMAPPLAFGPLSGCDLMVAAKAPSYRCHPAPRVRDLRASEPAGWPASVVVVGTDVSTQRRQEILVQAGLMLASELPLPALLQRIVELAAELAGARYAALGVLSPEGEIIQEFLTVGVTDEERKRIGPLPHGRGILGALITDARPLRLPRLQDDQRSVGFPPNHPPMTSFLGAPVAVRGKVFGNLYLTEKIGAEEFTAEDEDALVKLAAQAGIAIEFTRSQEELRRLALLQDRERIAKELHDDVIQSLFAEGMALQAALGVADDPDAIRSRLEASIEHIDRVIRDLRNYIFALRPGASADRQLDRSLRDLAKDFALSGMHVAVETDAISVSHLASSAADILQFAREAISNAVRHSGGRRVHVSLTALGDHALLEISDDGSGFDRSRAGSGHGLSNLGARAEALGGELEIESEPRRGTWVRVRIPL
jgi:signal transduction histidine kinase